MNALASSASALFLAIAPACAAPLDGTWGGTSAGGVAAEVTVKSGKASDITWHGKTIDVTVSRPSQNGVRLDFVFPKGSARLRLTAAGADLTIRLTGRGSTLVHVEPR